MDSNACYRRDTVGVIVSVRHPVLDKDTAICLGEKIVLNAGGGFAYQWAPSTGLSCDNCASPVASPLQTTLYSVYISDELGCPDTLKTLLTVHPLPVMSVNTRDTAIIYGKPVQLFARSSEGVRYYWSPATGLSDNLMPNPIANPTIATSYVVTVTDKHNCRSYDTVLVRVRTDVPILIPSAFTPNGDGVNDVFGVINLTFHRVIEFRVFNRWGQEVFSTQDSYKGWDGTYKGEKATPGVYQYLIRIANPDGQTQMYKGDVTLVQ
jgi:gliding motility-associated-like protein